MKHTPTPWRIGNHGGEIVADSSERIFINGAIEKDSVEYYGGFLVAESISQPNAAFIVLAVNMHDELVEAVKRVVTLYGIDRTPTEMDSVMKPIAELLAKAGGE